MQDACHVNFVIDHAHHGVSVAQWASERGIRRSEVRFLMGTQFNHVMQKREEGKARWLNLVACLFTLKGLLSCFCLFVCFFVRVVLLFRIDGATDYSLG